MRILVSIMSVSFLVLIKLRKDANVTNIKMDLYIRFFKKDVFTKST